MSTHTLTYTHTNIYVFMCVYTGFNFYLIKNVARMRVPNCSWVGKTRLTVFNYIWVCVCMRVSVKIATLPGLVY